MPESYKIAIFDLDGVVYEKPKVSHAEDNVAASSWDALFQELGIYDLHERLRNIYTKKGFKSYMEWSDAACCVLKARGLDKKTFDKVIESRELMKGTKETFDALRAKDILTGVVSGSFEALAQKARSELGLNYVLAHCNLIFDEKGALKNWKLFATDYKDKVKFVKYIAAINKVSMKECAYVGDDVNDVKVFEKVGLAIAFNSTKEKVTDAADIVVAGKDLREVLKHISSAK
jgi:phosphoserine phosphatase